jgi:hypothetical protein
MFKFPLFNGQRVQIESELVKRKSKNLWEKLKDAFNTPITTATAQPQANPDRERIYYCPSCGQECSQEEYESRFCLDCDFVDFGL